MTRLLSTAVAALALVAMPVWAQTTTPSSPAQVTVPSGQNSGAGISGKPGSKSGPAVQPPSSGTSTPDTKATGQENGTVREQDTAKIPGAPGNKSGPATKTPGSQISK
jgi:hypothetical protein